MWVYNFYERRGLVTNLTQEAKAKWAEAQAARNPAQKLRLLKEFYSMVPKHKGTQRLLVSLKRQISSLEEEVERAKSRRVGSTRLEWIVKKEALPQLAVVGSVESSVKLFNLLTGLEIKPHEPLLKPVVGAFEGGGVKFQLVLAPYDPSLGEEKLERFTNLARNSDLILITVRREGRSYLESLLEWFEEHNLDLKSDFLPVEVRETPSGGIRIVGYSEMVNERMLVDFLKGYGIRNAVVKLSRGATLDDVENCIFGRMAKRSLLILLEEGLRKELSDLISNTYILDPSSLERLAEKLLERLGLIRVYTKNPMSPPSDKPILVKVGCKVLEAAEQIHKELAEKFRYARVWRNGSCVRVGAYFTLEDGDLLEIHSG